MAKTPKTPEPPKKTPTPKGKSPADQARVLQERIKQSGKTSRAKGHVSAATRRNQTKRDARNG